MMCQVLKEEQIEQVLKVGGGVFLSQIPRELWDKYFKRIHDKELQSETRLNEGLRKREQYICKAPPIVVTYEVVYVFVIV